MRLQPHHVEPATTDGEVLTTAGGVAVWAALADILPAAPAEGQVLGWSGGQLAWITPGGDTPPSPLTDLYVYGHSWTTGDQLTDTTKAYPHLIATDLGLSLHANGVNGALVNEVDNRLFGAGGSPVATWQAGTTDCVVIVQSLLNSLRQYGINTDALSTARSALRTMMATLHASSRIEQGDVQFTYSGTWATSGADDSISAGGTYTGASTNGAYFQFVAVGGEYLSFRGRAGAGQIATATDQTSGGASLGTIDLSSRYKSDHIDPNTGGASWVWQVPAAMTGHTVRITRTGGAAGNFSFDVLLPQQTDPDRQIVLVKEPYINWAGSTVFTMGSDAACDTFNGIIDECATEWPDVIVVDLNAAGWDKDTMLLSAGTHPNETGHAFIADTIKAALGY